MKQIGDAALEDWEASGSMNVFHFGYGRIAPVRYELYEDARRYDVSTAAISMPTLVFQGKHDDVVDPAVVERWASTRSNVQLHMLDDAHQLTASLPVIWQALAGFLGVDC